MAALAPFDWRSFAQRPQAVIAAWALFVLVNLALSTVRGMDPVGPDDYMRLFEVRDLLAGQSWWDVNQYRIDPPDGASMHWSRLVDLPLALMVLIFGEVAAMIAVPLLYLLIALFALRSIMLRLGFGPMAMGFGLVILPLFPLLPGQFAPLRIDHHAPQAVLAICCAALLLHQTRRSAIVCGILAAAWVAVSLEGLPLVAALAAMFGIAYWWAGDRRLAWFLGSLAIAAPLLLLATRPAAAFALPFCDILLPGHMAAIAAAAVVAAIIPILPGQDAPRGRFAALCALPLAAAPVAVLTLGECATNPMAQLDPVLQHYWYGMITEGLPVWQQAPSTAAMLIWTLALVGAGWWIAGKNSGFDQDRGLCWTLLTLFALAAGGYSLLLMREGVVAQLLAIPFAAFLLAHFLPRARAIDSGVSRILATLACFLLATPTFASGAFKNLDSWAERNTLRGQAMAAMQGGPCDYGRLSALAPGHVFAPLDNGPEILGKTSHTIVMASYHRNQQRMVDVITAFTGSADIAAQIVRDNGAEYVVVCASEADLALYRSINPSGFANALFAQNPPQGLEPITGFDIGALRAFRVQQD